MKTSELLTAAKKYLWDGQDDNQLEDLSEHKSEYICFAISNVRHFELNLSEAPIYWLIRKTRDMIELRLFPWNNMDAWLLRGACIPPEQLTPDRVQAHRLAWMNLLIEEFKAKGD